MNNYKIQSININPILGYNKNQEIIQMIDNATLDEFLIFAKSYNIFQESTNKFYLFICQKIRDRLQKENLHENIIKPE